MERADDHRERSSAAAFCLARERGLLCHLQPARRRLRADLIRDRLHAQLHRTDGRCVPDGRATVLARDEEAAPANLTLQAALEQVRSGMEQLVLPTGNQEAWKVVAIHHRRHSSPSSPADSRVLPGRVAVGASKRYVVASPHLTHARMG